MDIIWLGHSCFRLRSGDVLLVTDPFPDSIGLSMGESEAQIVTVSNRHPNHCYAEGVQGIPQIIEGPGEYDLHGIYVLGLVTSSAEGDPPEARNTAYRVEMDGVSLLHLGDLRAPLGTGRIEELVPVDVLFVPVGGGCTLPLGQVVELIQSLDPKLVVPMHYGLPGVAVSLQPIDPLLRELGVRDVQPQARLSVTRSSLPQGLQVVVMEPPSLR